jgi:hypothetical protein
VLKVLKRFKLTKSSNLSRYVKEKNKVKLTQVAKNHFAFATALLWHYSFEIT